MRLVVGDEGQVDLVEERKGPLTQQPLGSHVEQVDASGTQPRLDVEHLAVVECRVEARRAHPGLQQRRDLIPHQGDER